MRLAKRAKMRILAALFLSLAFSASFAETRFLEGWAGRASDGDTFTLMLHDGGVARICPSGADAPERGQPYWRASRAHLVQLLEGGPVSAHCYKKDRDRRDVCRVYVQGRDVALEQVEAGYAWWFRQFANEQTEQERLDYERAENQARAARRGLWQEQNPEAPWVYRQRLRASRTAKDR